VGVAGKLDLKKHIIPAIVWMMFGGVAAQAAVPSLEEFALRPRLEDVSISPDGRYVAVIRTRDDGRADAVVADRQAGKDQVMRAVMTEPEHFQFTWCHWPTNTRLLCGFRGMVDNGFIFGITRLVGVDADGKHLRVLMQNSFEAQGQFQDRIIDWNPGPADTVLIEADEGMSANQLAAGVQVYGNVGTHALPGVFELNVVTGSLILRQHARDPIRHWITDEHGHVRLGWGFSGSTVSYWARLDGDSDWRRFEDNRIGTLMGAIQKIEPTRFNQLHGSSRDERILLIRSVSDDDAPRFMMYNSDTNQLSKIGAPDPDRDPATLASMRPISYPARDGTRIPAYLSAPPGAPATHLPLIVMPHGGPIARDTWGYFFLRRFLVSRGYAVLQMNFRGSSGYGEDWFFAAHQDWGGLTYDDVIDGARWAVQQGIADPQRVCIVGWSFGGYLALLGAQRDPEVFRCAVDIAGPSDLALLIDEGHHWLQAASIKRQIGTDPAKLKRDSPRLHAADFQIPLLMIQGKMDAQVPFEQSEKMDEALTRAGKAHRFVAVPGADHQFSDLKDRVTLLQETEAFLREHLPAATH
jgi:dipeptidyl aminopeptidase/acylaminoacyl peptidase